MKKLLVVALLAVMACALVACSGNQEQAAQPAQSGQTEDVGQPGENGMPNPLVEYASLDELQEAAGFPVVSLLDDTKYQATAFILIDKSTAQITYVKLGAEDPAMTDITLRIAPVAGELDGAEVTGIYGVEYTPKDLYGVAVNTTVADDVGNDLGQMQGAWFTYNDYIYSLSAQGIDSTEFENLLKEVLTLAGVEAK